MFTLQLRLYDIETSKHLLLRLGGWHQEKAYTKPILQESIGYKASIRNI